MVYHSAVIIIFQNDAVTVVLYNMFDTYVDIGEANIVSSDVAKGLTTLIMTLTFEQR